MQKKLHFLAWLAFFLSSHQALGQWDYPPAFRGAAMDTYHGESVDDPYRWLEDLEGPETQEWVGLQEELLESFTASISERSAFTERILAVGRFDRRSAPQRKGSRVFHTETRAGEAAPRIYVSQKGEHAKALFEPANDLTDAEQFGSFTPSQEGNWCVIRLRVGDAPFQEMRVLDVRNGQILADRVRNIWSGPSWLPDESGFFYARFPERKGEMSLEALGSPTIWLHRIGTSQEQDRLIYAHESDGAWLIRKTVTHDGRYLLLNCAKGSDFSGLDDEIHFIDLQQIPWEPKLLVAGDRGGRWAYEDNRADRFWFRTTEDAPNGRLVEMRAGEPKSGLQVIVPEQEHSLATVSAHPDRLSLGYLVDARTEFRFYTHEGELLNKLRLPGNVTGLSSNREEDVIYYSSSLLFDPGSLYALDVRTGESTLFWRPELQHNPEQFAIRQVFYRSQDGTRVPMWIAGRKDVLAERKPAPLFMYSYGALGWAAFPWYQPHMVVWMEQGGLYALPGIRGGGEYGDGWWKAGKRLNRQNAIDDILAASEWLCEAGFTNPHQFVVNGGSASGVLAAAAAMQRPDLYAAALIDVPKLDMLRYHLFTGSNFSVGDSGTSENPEDYAVLRSYSPLHNVQPGVDYPAFLVNVGENDGTCPPLHGYKFIAEMQARSTSPNPAMLLFMRDTGHGWGKTPEVRSRHQAIALAFLFQTIR